MSAVTIHSGDFPAGEGKFFPSMNRLVTPGNHVVATYDLAICERATEESVRRLAPALGWGALGGLLLGPAGLLAGLLVGARARRLVTFVAATRDGRRMVATADEGDFAILRAAVL